MKNSLSNGIYCVLYLFTITQQNLIKFSIHLQKAVPRGHNDDHLDFIKIGIFLYYVRHHYCLRRTLLCGVSELVNFQYLIYLKSEKFLNKGRKDIVTCRMLIHLLQVHSW